MMTPHAQSAGTSGRWNAGNAPSIAAVSPTVRVATPIGRKSRCSSIVPSTIAMSEGGTASATFLPHLGRPYMMTMVSDTSSSVIHVRPAPIGSQSFSSAVQSEKSGLSGSAAPAA